MDSNVPSGQNPWAFYSGINVLKREKKGANGAKEVCTNVIGAINTFAKYDGKLCWCSDFIFQVTSMGTYTCHEVNMRVRV